MVSHRVGIEAGRDRRARIADRGQPRVDGGDVRGSDRDEPGLIELALLEVGEVERPVAHDRAAEAGAVLLSGSSAASCPESGFARVEAIVAEVAVEVAVQRVGAALGDDVDVAAERAAELGLPARRHHLELLDRVDAVRDAAQPGGVVVGRQAVDDEVVREIALAADRERLRRARPTSRRKAACCRRWSATRRARAAPGRGSCGRSAAGLRPRSATPCRRSGCAPLRAAAAARRHRRWLRQSAPRA